MLYITIAPSILLLSLFVVANFQLKLFYPAKNKLRILEYHSISTDGFEDQITIKKENLVAQFEYLKKNNYKTLWLSEIDALRKSRQPLPEKTVVLTFDDGFVDNYTELYPLLEQYDFKAVCFVVFGRMGQKADWSRQFVRDGMQLMTKEQLAAMSGRVELGYHTFKHDSYTKLTFDEIEEDLKLCQQLIKEEKLNVFPALAYTYGRYHRKKGPKQQQLFQLLEKYGIQYALRIGNRINVFPMSSQYELQRIDIRGKDSFKTFKKKVKFGREKLFS